MDRYVCIHGHFYQPPRENPWLEFVELQDSAYPYHDWNERVTAECYEPNAAARILDAEGYIVRILNNYAWISFNVGPTLLQWMEAHAPEVYRAILDADRESRDRFSGHGSALAQVYNHMILPLANPRDRRTQVLWGIRDFEARFGRSPEGMWLPETAADVATLETLAECGIRFTILAPHQAARVRRIGATEWEDVSGGRIDPTMAYRARLPSGRRLDLFFYDGPIARAVAFEGLLTSGEAFAARLAGAFSDARGHAQLVHIATDGETYGHHHRHGEMALAYALHRIQTAALARLTTYGEFLERHPPTHEVEIAENTSWSCAHGIERWRRDCGCRTGGAPGWTQAWRAPLRAALDALRDTVAPRYEARAREFFRDPWAARDDYIRVVLDRSPESFDRFLGDHAHRVLGPEEKVTALKLLECQRHAMLMYTSCGWFFSELSGIETVQVIRYAGRVVQLAEELFGDDLESTFLERLAQAKSNLPEFGDGARIYERFVRPATVDLQKVAAHYALSALFEAYPERARIYAYTVEREDERAWESGRTRLRIGRARVTSDVTQESGVFTFAVWYFGDHNLNGGVRPYRDPATYEAAAREFGETFERVDISEAIHLLDRHFGDHTYSLRSLFRDEQRKIVDLLLASTLEEVAAEYRQVYEHHAGLMRFVADLGIPLPRAFHTAAEFVVNAELRRGVEAETLDPDRIRSWLHEARRWNVPLDEAELRFALERTLERMADAWRAEPGAVETLAALDAAVALVRELPFEVELWKLQNVYYEIARTLYPARHAEAEAGDEPARAWTAAFAALGDRLRVRLP
jgi:alpha-amylase/alpha-mannosidase (GH57 family)